MVQVGKEGVRPAPEETEAYRGVAAPKRKVVQDDPSAPIEMPKVPDALFGCKPRCWSHLVCW